MQKFNGIIIGYREFEEIVKNTLDLPQYDYVADTECGNDVFHVFFNVTGEDDFFFDKIDAYRRGEITHLFYTGSILELLVLYEILEPASYIIWVTW